MAQRATTTSAGRWYNYADYLKDANVIGYSAIYLWNDTTSVDAYLSSISVGPGSGTVYAHNDIVSVGLVCDPFYAGWNDPLLYQGNIQLTPADTYVIDSVYVSGIYYRNNDNTGPVDTLTVSVLYGNGGTSSDLHYKAIDTSGGREWIQSEYGGDSLFYMNMHFDSANVRADTFEGGFTPVTQKIYLSSADTSGDYETVLPVHISVPAGNIPALSVSFKSGDPAFTAGDTVFVSDGTNTRYKYGMFRPILAYLGSANNPAFPANSKDDLSEGQFRDQGPDRAANNIYRPSWFWYNAATGGASTYQYPYFAFHVTCASCTTVGVAQINKNVASVGAYPNPADGTVTIATNAANTTNMLISLSNMLGQNVAVATVNTDGKAIFNTTGLPNGLYIYTIVVNGERKTGRIIIAHQM